MRHLANAHSVTGPAGSIFRTSVSGVWWERLCRPVKQLSIRVLTYNNLIYLLNLQFSVVFPFHTCEYCFQNMQMIMVMLMMMITENYPDSFTNC